MKLSSSEPTTHGIAYCLCTIAVVLMCVVSYEVDVHPRTDDATVRANLIPFAAEVEGKLTRLNVRDNEPVHKGDLLFEIDPRPYEYALDEALAAQTTLEGEIHDQERRIAAQQSAVGVSRADLATTRSSINASDAAWTAAVAASKRAEAVLASETSRANLAKSDYERIAPLLEKHFVTSQQVDESQTTVEVATRSVAAAEAQLAEARAHERVALAAISTASSGRDAAQAHLGQAEHTVDTLETLKAQRAMRQAAVDRARLSLEWCQVRAPFNGYVSNMSIAQGAYAHVGASMFTLVDTEQWWVVASYRESKLKHITPGMHVDIYIMENPGRKFDGVVESIGTGVFPEDGAINAGLPDVDRTLNWVHLSARFPVRVRVIHPDPGIFRIGASAVTVVR